MKRGATQKRGRPNKSDEQKKRDIDLTTRLVKEIRRLSKKSYKMLADTLFNPLDIQNENESITGETLRQYSSGHSAASASRRRYMAGVALEHGYGGIEATRALKRSGLIEDDPYREYYRKVMEKQEQKAVALAEKGVAALATVFCAESASSLLESMVARLCHPYVADEE